MAFSLVEILVAVAILALLLCVLLPTLGRQKRSSQLSGCLANLKQVALAELLWINDHEKSRLSWHYSTNEGGTLEYLEGGKLSPHFNALSNELVEPRFLTCPADNREIAKTLGTLRDSNLSYFMAMDTYIGPNARRWETLEEWKASIPIFGDRNVTNNSGPQSGIIKLDSTNYTSLGWNLRLHNAEKHSTNRLGNLGYVDGSVATVNSSNLVRDFRYESLNSEKNRLAVP